MNATPTTLAIPHSRLDQAWHTWMAVHGATLARKTRAEYRCAWRLALRCLPDPCGLGSLARLRAALAATYSPAYTNQIVATLRTITRRAAYLTGDAELAAVVWQLTPLRALCLPRRCPPDDLLIRSLSVARNPAERLWLELAGLGGLRRGELLGLRPEDWDPITGTLSVVRQRYSPQRKNRRPHTLRVDDPAVRADLLWTLSHRREVRARSGWFRDRGSSYLFPWSSSYVTAFASRLRSALGPEYLPCGLAWHGYRHWGATQLARRGATPYGIRAWLGGGSMDVALSYVDMYRGTTFAAVSILAPLARRYSQKKCEHGQRSNAGHALNRPLAGLGVKDVSSRQNTSHPARKRNLSTGNRR